MLSLLAAETTAHGADHVEESVFPPFNPEYWESQSFWLIVTFVVLYVVMSRLILPRMASTLERRSSRIAADLDEAERLNEEATEAQQALELEMARARSEARETATKAQARIDAELAEQTAEADAKIEEKLAAAEATIANLRSEAMAKVEDIATETAETLARRLGANVTPADARSAVQAALNT